MCVCECVCGGGGLVVVGGASMWGLMDIARGGDLPAEADSRPTDRCPALVHHQGSLPAMRRAPAGRRRPNPSPFLESAMTDSRCAIILLAASLSTPS